MSPAASSTNRTLLFLATIVCAVGALSEFPIRWFVRAGLAVAAVVVGAGVLFFDRRAAGRSGQLVRADLVPSLKSTCWFLLWCEVAVLSLRYLRQNAFPYYTWDPAVFQLLWDRRLLVIVHITAGVTALLLGPAQFFPEWRARALAVHRWLGRVYVVSVGIGGTAALYLSWFVAPYEGGLVTGAAMAVLAVVWLGATFAGWRFAVARRIATHREWMFRSYVLTLAFVALRWNIGFAQQAVLPWLHRALGVSVPFEQAVPIAVWCSWMIPLALVEIAIRAARSPRELRFVK